MASVHVATPSGGEPSVADGIARVALADVAELRPVEPAGHPRRPTREHERVALVTDLPRAGLVAGEVGAVVGVWTDGVYELEFVDPAGRPTASTPSGPTNSSGSTPGGRRSGSARLRPEPRRHGGRPVDESAEDLIRPELAAGEPLLWAGRPPQGFRLQAADALLIPLSLMWGGFAIFWEVMAVAGGAPWFFALWGVPFVLVGLYLIAGRFWHDAAHRARTVYGITPERVVIVSGLFARRVKSVSVDTISDLTLTGRACGAGTIALGPAPPGYGWWTGTNWVAGGVPAAPALELPAAAREVYETIRAAQRAAKGRG